MKIEHVEELLRTGHRSPTIWALELLIQSTPVWDAISDTVFRAQLGLWTYTVAVIDPDHLKVLCVDGDGGVEIVSIIRRTEQAQQVTARRRSSR
jgi:hypothetical protein